MNMFTQLTNFAIQTLRLMEGQKEWSADTLDEISAVAQGLGLAGVGADGYFQLGRIHLIPPPGPDEKIQRALSDAILVLENWGRYGEAMKAHRRGHDGAMSAIGTSNDYFISRLRTVLAELGDDPASSSQ